MTMNDQEGRDSVSSTQTHAGWNYKQDQANENVKPEVILTRQQRQQQAKDDEGN